MARWYFHCEVHIWELQVRCEFSFSPTLSSHPASYESILLCLSRLGSGISAFLQKNRSMRQKHTQLRGLKPCRRGDGGRTGSWSFQKCEMLARCQALENFKIGCPCVSGENQVALGVLKREASWCPFQKFQMLTRYQVLENFKVGCPHVLGETQVALGVLRRERGSLVDCRDLNLNSCP